MTRWNDERDRGWPPVAHDRRAVLDARTIRGEQCTVVLVRHAEGPLVGYLHGAAATSVVLTPAVHAELITALQDLTG